MTPDRASCTRPKLRSTRRRLSVTTSGCSSPAASTAAWSRASRPAARTSGTTSGAPSTTGGPPSPAPRRGARRRAAARRPRPRRRRRTWCRRRRPGWRPARWPRPSRTSAWSGASTSSGSRSLRTTTCVAPSASRAAGRCRWGRGSATACSTESRSRRVPAGATVTCARAIHGAGSSTWIGSSMVRPQVCTANPAPGSTIARVGPGLVVEVGRPRRATAAVCRRSHPSVRSEPAAAGPAAASTSTPTTPTAMPRTGTEGDVLVHPQRAGAAAEVTKAPTPRLSGSRTSGRTCGCCAAARARCRGRGATRRRSTEPAQPPLPAVSTARPTSTRPDEHPTLPQPLLHQTDQADRRHQRRWAAGGAARTASS